MRLWHYKLLPLLPKSQLLAQWRELNSIFKKQDKHILINYIYNDLTAFWCYSNEVIYEMVKRKYKIKSLDNWRKFFENCGGVDTKHKEFDEHNDEYLTICYWNLREKYLRGQKDFTIEIWNGISTFYNATLSKGR